MTQGLSFFHASASATSSPGPSGATRHFEKYPEGPGDEVDASDY